MHFSIKFLPNRERIASTKILNFNLIIFREFDFIAYAIVFGMDFRGTYIENHFKLLETLPLPEI